LFLATLLLLALPLARAIDIGPIPIYPAALITIPVSLVTGDPLVITAQSFAGPSFGVTYCLGSPDQSVNQALCFGTQSLSSSGGLGGMYGMSSTGQSVGSTLFGLPSSLQLEFPFNTTITKAATQWEIVLAQGATSASYTFPFFSDPSPSVANTLLIVGTLPGGSPPQYANIVNAISFPQALGAMVPSPEGFSVPVTGFTAGQSVTLTVSGSGRIFFGGPTDEVSTVIGFLLGSNTIQFVSTSSSGTIYEGAQVSIATNSQPYSITITVIDNAQGFSVLVQQGSYTKSFCWPVFVGFPNPSTITNFWFVSFGSLRVYDVLLS